MLSLTRRQWLTLIALSIESFVTSASVSIEAPFYPKLATQKSCSLTEIGLVFSIFEIVIFIICPLMGKHLYKFGIKLVFVCGLFILSIFCILFGFLNYLNGHSLFLSISLLIRFIEAVGTAAILTAKIAIIAQEFPENIGTSAAIIEVIVSIGFVFGSSVGGLLYELDGYTIPFVVYGVLIFVVAVIASIILPNSNVTSSNESEVGHSLLSAIKLPSILLALMATLTAAITTGFLLATLEPFLRQFHLKPSTLGIVFGIPRIVYVCTGVLIGRICDKMVSAKIVILFGTVLQVFAFAILGPAPFIPVKSTRILVIIGLIIHGFGFAMQFIGTFIDLVESTLAEGYANDLKTNGLVSGSWNSAFSLGAFIGPTLGGIIVDQIGFRKACMYIAGSQAIIGIVLFGYIVYNNKVKKYVALKDEADLQHNITTAESC